MTYTAHIEKFIQTPEEAQFWGAKVTMLQFQHPNLSESNTFDLLVSVLRDEFRSRVWLNAMTHTKAHTPTWMVNTLLNVIDNVDWLKIAGDLMEKHYISPTLKPQAEIFTLEPEK